MDIGSIFRKYRAVKNLSQGELAQHIGITQNYLSMVELGKKIPSTEVISRFAEYSKISINALSVIISGVPNELTAEEKMTFYQLQHVLKEIIFS